MISSSPRLGRELNFRKPLILLSYSRYLCQRYIFPFFRPGDLSNGLLHTLSSSALNKENAKEQLVFETSTQTRAQIISKVN